MLVVFLSLFFNCLRQKINLRMNIIYSERATFTSDNSNTIDHIHRSINIHRALRICKDVHWFGWEVGEMRLFLRFIKNNIPTFFPPECLMTKQATNQTLILFSISLDGVGF